MRKKIIFGSCFSTFLLLSLIFINPVHATSSEFFSTINNLALSLSEDQDFLDMIDDDDLDDLIDLAINEDEWDKEFENQIENKLNIIVNKVKFNRLVIRYEDDINILKQKIPERGTNIQQTVDSGIYYKIKEENQELEFYKENNPDITGNGIVVSSEDDSINIIGIGCLSGTLLNLLIRLLNLITSILDPIAKVARTIATVLSIVAFIVNIFSKTLGDAIKVISGFASTIASVITAISNVLKSISSVLEFIYNIINPKVKENTINKISIKEIKQRMIYFIKRILNFKLKFEPIPFN